MTCILEMNVSILDFNTAYSKNFIVDFLRLSNKYALRIQLYDDRCHPSRHSPIALTLRATESGKWRES